MIDKSSLTVIFTVLQIVVLLFIFFQDYKERMVYWFLFPVVGIIGGLIQINLFPKEVFFLNSLYNLILVSLLLGIGGIYMKLIRKKSFVNESMGSGDILFFIFLCFCFPTITFVVLLVFSLFFSLVIHIILIKKEQNKTVPLAGLMALFFGSVYFLSLFTPKSLIFSY
ncbi:MAG TPA: general secretion pathway protein [Flavobacterium sp.]|uniref:general secretion pathway protein n=1 Tax=unclassified Flavobacterium TaxID=196869 RepID=UPI0025BD0C53|nr:MULTISPECIES: general secretion pathway protein [unclassified Flavobacterium]HRE76418.1 general secretion pathway protein [Flavobacterium sp.]